MPSKKPTAPMRRVLEGLNEAETTISPVTPASMMLVAQLKSAGLVQMCPILNGYEISPAGRRALKGGGDEMVDSSMFRGLVPGLLIIGAVLGIAGVAVIWFLFFVAWPWVHKLIHTWEW